VFFESEPERFGTRRTLTEWEAMSQRPLRVVPAQEADASPAGTPDGLDFDDFFARESEGLFQRLWLVTRDRAEAEEVM
jgi:hypothetical protein